MIRRVSSEYRRFRFNREKILYDIHKQADDSVTYEMCTKLHREIKETEANCPLPNVTYEDHIRERQQSSFGFELGTQLLQTWKTSVALTTAFGIPISLMFMISTETPQTLFVTLPLSLYIPYALIRQERKDKYLKWATKFYAFERLKNKN